MKFYSTIFTLHIMFAGAWLINLVFNSILRKRIVIIKHKASEKKFISLYMTFANLFGMIGATGILITGISMVLLNPGYGFFLMTSNHWLATKQILMVTLLITIGAFIIPTAKKIRAAIGEQLESSNAISEEGYKNLDKLFKLNFVVNIIVLINFLLAITHRFFI